MNHRELDCLIIGFSVGALAFLWIGYQLRKRVERWYARREQRAHQRALGRQSRQSSKSIPFGDLSDPLGFHKMTGRTAGDIAMATEQDARRMIKRQKIIPLVKWNPTPPDGAQHPREVPVIKIVGDHDRGPWEHHGALADDVARREATCRRAIREEALVCLTSAGYKRATAETALDACTLTERAGGLESWIAAALRRAATKP